MLLSKPADELNPLTREIKESDGTPASPRMVRRGGDAARVQALLAADATDCWHLLSWWWSGFLGALPPSLWSLLLSIQSSPLFFCTIIRILLAVLVEFPRCASPLDQPRTRTILLTLCLFCRSKNNSSKESQVGVMWSSLCERVIILACAALQPRM